MADNKRHYTREMAEWAAGVSFDDIPPRVVEQAKLQQMSVLASIFASARASAGPKIPGAQVIRNS